MWPRVIIEVLPFLELFIKYICVIDDHAFEHSIKLIVIDPMTSFDFTIEPRPTRFNIDMLDSLV